MSPQSTGSLGHNNDYPNNEMFALLRLDLNSRAPCNASPEVFLCLLLRIKT